MNLGSFKTVIKRWIGLLENNIRFSGRRVIIISIMAVIAIIHILRIGNYLSGELYYFYYSFFSDLILPFGGYFLLCAAVIKLPILRHWKPKLVISFLVPALAETFQFFGLPVFGSTFDPLDYLMYAFGAILAAIIDVQVFPRIFKFWVYAKMES
jgi:hypothetical protein